MTTGRRAVEPPHWRSRFRDAFRLLLATFVAGPIAVQCGFADAYHFSRRFRSSARGLVRSIAASGHGPWPYPERVRMNADVQRLLAAQDPAIGALADALCTVILGLYPEAVVSVDGKDIGFGATAGYKGLVFVVSPHAKHVTLGIAHGAGLPDPAGLLEGAGKVHRHVKLRTPADLDRPELLDLMAAALNRAG
jgi:hypothetical protein